MYFCNVQQSLCLFIVTVICSLSFKLEVYIYLHRCCHQYIRCCNQCIFAVLDDHLNLKYTFVCSASILPPVYTTLVVYLFAIVNCNLSFTLETHFHLSFKFLPVDILQSLLEQFAYDVFRSCILSLSINFPFTNLLCASVNIMM